jgi:hypothetical protein
MDFSEIFKMIDKKEHEFDILKKFIEKLPDNLFFLINKKESNFHQIIDELKDSRLNYQSIVDSFNRSKEILSYIQFDQEKKNRRRSFCHFFSKGRPQKK